MANIIKLIVNPCNYLESKLVDGLSIYNGTKGKLCIVYGKY